ncbi:transposase [Streptomyces sp. NPDC091219]|uniref:transposase n=1 Tax=Streptomyces sp. NPDC091219 TaxID=3155193 RepID=UPI0034506D98
MADGKRLIGPAGAVLLRRCADRTGLTDPLAGVLPSSTAAGWRDRAGVLVHLAIAIVLGAANLSEAEQLQLHHRPLFGIAASDSTARSMLAVLDGATLAKIAKARAKVRRQVWSLLHLRPGGFPWLTVAGKRLTGWIVIDLDATIITSASNLAADLDAWLRLLALHDIDGLANAEPDTMRFRLYHLSARLAEHARRRWLRIERTWPWATSFTTCWQQLTALPAIT